MLTLGLPLSLSFTSLSERKGFSLLSVLSDFFFRGFTFCKLVATAFLYTRLFELPQVPERHLVNFSSRNLF